MGRVRFRGMENNRINEFIFHMPDQACEQISGINPLWFILLVNVFALFAVPYLSFIYSHVSNLKTLKEKWITNVRDAAISILEASEKLFRENEQLYTLINNKPSGNDQIALNEERMEVARREIRNIQSEFFAHRSKLRLLFQEDDQDFSKIDKLVEKLKEAADKPGKGEDGVLNVLRKRKNPADENYVTEFNKYLHAQWDTVQKPNFWAHVFRRKST